MREFSIGDVAAQTGVAESTLRMWEHRHGFPSPARLAGGHRRYSELDVDSIRRAAALRQTGLSLTAAIASAMRPAETPTSLHAQLRSDHPELSPHLLSRASLLALTHAIEDEMCVRAQRAVMFGFFQREEFYRREERRWQQFSDTAQMVCVFADFKRAKRPARGPIELPIDARAHLRREWSIVWEAPGLGVCLSGWEAPKNDQAPPPQRMFETVWSVEPRIVRSAARTCAAIARPSISKPIDGLKDRLDSPPLPATEARLSLATAITGRMLAGLSRPHSTRVALRPTARGHAWAGTDRSAHTNNEHQ